MESLHVVYHRVTRKIVSFSDPRLFFIDPVLLAMAILHRRGCFGKGSVKEIFGKNVVIFPISNEWKKRPVFASLPKQ